MAGVTRQYENFSKSDIAGMTTDADTNNSTMEAPVHSEVLVAVALSETATALGILAVAMNVLFLVGARAARDTATPYFTILQNLAVADLLASTMFLVTQNWPRGPFAFIEPSRDLLLVLVLPYVFRSTPWMFMTVYFLSLTLLTVSHYFAVCKPWRYSELTERNSTKRILLLIWALSSLQIIVPVTVLVALCMQEDRQKAMNTLFTVSRVEAQIWMVLFALSTLINALLNVLIYRKIKLLRTKRKQMKMSYLSQETRIINRKQRAFVTVTLLIIISIFCRLPLPVVGLVGFMIHDPLSSYLLNAVVILLLYVNFVADPIIYIVRISEVHVWYKSLLLSFISKFSPCGARGEIPDETADMTDAPSPSPDVDLTQQFALSGQVTIGEETVMEPQEASQLLESSV